jgi:hypothetical protein
MAFILPFFVRAQQAGDDSSANCLTFWQKGDTRAYSIIHDQNTVQPDHTGTSVHFVYDAMVTVLEATETDYTVKWVFHLPDTSGTEGISNILPVFNGMQVIYKISDMGVFLELVNWEEVRDNYLKLMELSLPKQDSSTTASINATRIYYNSREAVESSLIKEVQLFHLPYGYTFTKTKMLVNTKLSSPFGKEPLPAIQSFQVTSLFPELNRFTLVIEQHVDRANTGPAFDAILKRMNNMDEKKLKSARAQLEAFEVNDYSEYQFVRSTGWIRQLLYSRTAVNAGVIQSDAYTILMKD